MSEEGFVRFAATTYALDEALDELRKEREEEEEEERAKRLVEEESEETPPLPKPKRVVALVRRPDPSLVVDPALRALLTKPR